MIRHYLKMIWNRRRSNALVMLEIFLSFLVVFAVMLVGLQYADNYRRPIGFSTENVWAVAVDIRTLTGEGQGADVPREVRDTFAQVLAAARELPEVVGVAAATSTPYGHSHWVSGSNIGSWQLRYGVAFVTDDFGAVNGLDIVRGRWFDRRDDGATWKPVVINQVLATEIFGSREPIGGVIPEEKRPDGVTGPEKRVVGVVREYRQDGELPSARSPKNYLFQRYTTDDPAQRPPSNLLLKLRPGTTAVFEERLVKRLQAAAKDWSFEVRTVDQLRDTWMMETLGPLAAAATVAGFLILMVGMGLTGVLWQTVTQRTREVGLRRAKGATIGDIRAQIFGELAVMASIALVAGTAIVVQFPLLKIFDFVPNGVYAASLVVSAACIYLLTMACAWYPSRLATSIQPAEALHYE
jgi:putative ABC transport system permease protein